MALVAKVRAEFDARQATEAMYALNARARDLNKRLEETRKRMEESNDPELNKEREKIIKGLEAELAAVEKLNKSIERSIKQKGAFQQIVEEGTKDMSLSRLLNADRNAMAVQRAINPADEFALEEMQQAMEVSDKARKAAASLKNGFVDAMKAYEEGVDSMSLPALRRLEAALTEVQKFSADPDEWKRYEEAIRDVRQTVQGFTGEFITIKEALNYGKEIDKGTFSGTIADLERAKKALKEYRVTIEQTADGSKELKQVDEALENIDEQIKGCHLTTEKFAKILAEPKGKSFDDLKAAIERAEKQLHAMPRETEAEKEAFQNLYKQIVVAKEELNDFDDAQQDTSIGMEELTQKAKQLAGAYLSLQGFAKVWEKNVEMSDYLADVRKTTGMTADEIQNLMLRVQEIDTRTAQQQLMELGATAGQLGLQSVEQVTGFVTAANQITTALNDLGTDGVASLMKVAQVTGAVEKEGGDIEKVLLRVGSSINELSNTTSAMAAPITDFVGRVGGVASAAKIAMADIAALGATTDQLAISAELAGTQMNVFLGGMQRHADAVAQVLGTSRDTVQAMFDQGQAMDVLVQLLEKMRDMNAVELNDFLKEMGSSGSRATQVFQTLAKNVDTLRTNIETSNKAYREGVSITNEYNTRNESAAGIVERLKNDLEEVFVRPGIINGIKAMAEAARTFLKVWMNPYLAPAFNAITVFLASSLLGVNKLSLAMNKLKLKIAEAGSVTKGFAVVWKSFWSANWPSIILGIGAAIGTMLVEWYTKAQQVRRETEALIGKIREERKAVDELFEPLRKANLQEEEKRRLIAAINSQYGTYLGKMLTEASNAQEIARAYEAINTQLQKKNILEGMEANNKKIREEHADDVNDAAANLRNRIARSAPKSNVPEIREAIVEVIKQFENTDILALDPNNPKRYGEDYTKFDKAMTEALRKLWQGGNFNANIKEYEFDNIKAEARLYWKELYNIHKEQTKVNEYLQDELDYTVNKIRRQADTDIPEMVKRFETSKGLHTEVSQFTAEESKKVVEAYDAVKSYYESHRTDLAEDQLKKLETIINTTGIQEFRTKAVEVKGTTSTTELEYTKQSTEHLKTRKKELEKMSSLLEEDFDITTLHYDEQFKKTGIETVEAAREWFNEQMQQIQTVLDARKNAAKPEKEEKSKKDKRPKQPESEAAIAELDRYYEERKELISIAHIEEGLSEEEYNRRMEALEQEHLQKRHDLRDSFTSEDKAFIQQFRKWWESVAELDEVEWSGIEAEWKVALERDRKRNNYMAEKDLASMRAIVVKHLNAIDNIISKERPYDGITRNLQDNLTKMGILFADMDAMNKEALTKGNGKKFDDAAYVEQNTKRVAFLLGEAEHAYSLTIEELLQKMAAKGMSAWAEELNNNPNGDAMKQALLAQLRTAYDAIQEAIKKEASLIKKHVDIQWNDVLSDGKSAKGMYESLLSRLGLQEDAVKRANSLIGAGYASEKVADKLAIKQMQIKLRMQEQYFLLIRKTGMERIAQLEAAGKHEDAEHVRKSMNLALTQEQKTLDEQRVALANKLEESQNRLYTELKSWAELLSSSLQSVFEASNTGNAEYYNERAKLQLTGGSGNTQQYIVIDNAGTSDATAHYETLAELEALERKHEIEQQNAMADAWKKVMDDINMKMNEAINDQLNAMLQDASLDANAQALGNVQTALISEEGAITQEQMEMLNNTHALGTNTAAINSLAAKMDGKVGGQPGPFAGGFPSDTESGSGNTPAQETSPLAPAENTENTIGTDWGSMDIAFPSTEAANEWAQQRMELNNQITQNAIANASKRQKAEAESDNKIAGSAQSAFARMTQAANLYGAAYAAVSNDNMSWSQKFASIAIQAAGNTAITMLTTKMSETTASTVADTPAVLSKLWKQLGWGAVPVFAIFTGLLGGLMGLAASAISKGKSEISAATGTRSSVASGRLATGMLTYAEGNVNEFTDPSTLTPGKHYNVDAADGRTYRARYMGKNPRTHITNGPEFHLTGERGREAIIDAATTRHIQMDEVGIWRAIQTLSAGGSLNTYRPRRGVRTFADGNLDDFEEMGNVGSMGNIGGMDIIAMQASLDRNSAIQEALLERLSQPIQAKFDVYGKGGLVDSYDTGKKTVQRYGQRY